MANDKNSKKTKSENASPKQKKKYVKPVLIVKSIENYIGGKISVFANYYSGGS